MPTTPFAAEHDALRDAVRRFVGERLAPNAASWTDLPEHVLAEAGALGYLRAHLDGGDGLLAGLVVAEELGRCGSAGVAAELLDAAHGAAALLARTGSSSAVLEAALAGRRRVAAALGRAPANRVSAEASDTGWRLDGTARLVLGGLSAGAALIRAEVDGDPAVFLVELPAEGWHAERIAVGPGWDAAEVAAVTVEALAVGAEQRVASSAEILAAHEGRARLMQAAAATTAAWRAWEQARDYALTREAFGRPIGRFQVNRHALARMATCLTAATQLIRDAVVALVDHRPAAVSEAVRFALRTAVEATDVSLQLHGGYGYTMEYDVQRAWRDARSTQLVHEPADAADLRGVDTRIGARP